MSIEDITSITDITENLLKSYIRELNRFQPGRGNQDQTVEGYELLRRIFQLLDETTPGQELSYGVIFHIRALALLLKYKRYPEGSQSSESKSDDEGIKDAYLSYLSRANEDPLLKRVDEAFGNIPCLNPQEDLLLPSEIFLPEHFDRSVEEWMQTRVNGIPDRDRVPMFSSRAEGLNYAAKQHLFVEMSDNKLIPKWEVEEDRLVYCAVSRRMIQVEDTHLEHWQSVQELFWRINEMIRFMNLVPPFLEDMLQMERLHYPELQTQQVSGRGRIITRHEKSLPFQKGFFIKYGEGKHLRVQANLWLYAFYMNNIHNLTFTSVSQGTSKSSKPILRYMRKINGYGNEFFDAYRVTSDDERLILITCRGRSDDSRREPLCVAAKKYLVKKHYIEMTAMARAQQWCGHFSSNVRRLEEELHSPQDKRKKKKVEKRVGGVLNLIPKMEALSQRVSEIVGAEEPSSDGSNSSPLNLEHNPELVNALSAGVNIKAFRKIAINTHRDFQELFLHEIGEDAKGDEDVTFEDNKRKGSDSLVAESSLEIDDQNSKRIRMSESDADTSGEAIKQACIELLSQIPASRFSRIDPESFSSLLDEFFGRDSTNEPGVNL